MILKELEAKGKWCPFSRIVVAEETGAGASLASGYNRMAIRNTSRVQIPDASKCLGSACMLWHSVDIQGDRGYCGLSK